MPDVSETLIKLIQARLDSRKSALSALSITTMDMSAVPDDVKMMREIEGAKIRSVMEEQKDLIDIIRIAFPASKPEKPKEKIRKSLKEKKPEDKK